jgi:hypothetical protein
MAFAPLAAPTKFDYYSQPMHGLRFGQEPGDDIVIDGNNVETNTTIPPGIGIGHTHSISGSTLATRIRGALLSLLRSNTFANTVQSYIATAMRGVRQNYAISTERLVHRHWEQRAVETIEVVYAGKRCVLRFRPQPDITAYEMYRCNQVRDRYVPYEEVARFIVDNNILRHFEDDPTGHVG